jgi:hypothetical protein
MNQQREEKIVKLSDEFNEAETEGTLLEVKRGRKQFVEPEVSGAIKVLKATQFFQQFSDNGNTGRPNS